MAEPDPRATRPLVLAALTGVGLPPSGSGLDDVLPPGPPELTLLRRAGLIELARRAAGLPERPRALPEPDEAVDERALASPGMAALIAFVLRTPGKLIEVLDELFTVLAARGLRLPPFLAPTVMTHPALRDHPACAALVGARGVWLAPYLPPPVPARPKKPKAVPEPPPAEAWRPGVAPEPQLIEALAHLPRPFPAEVSASVAAWLPRFRDPHELQRHPLGSAMRAVALGLRREHLAPLLERAPQLYRRFRDAVIIAETRRRFYEELNRADPT